MALCQYCRTVNPDGTASGVEIAWHNGAPHVGQYRAYPALRDAQGRVITQQHSYRDTKTGKTRSTLRPVPDVNQAPHYPHQHHGLAAGQRTATECPEWTPTKAAVSKKARGSARGSFNTASAAAAAIPPYSDNDAQVTAGVASLVGQQVTVQAANPFVAVAQARGIPVATAIGSAQEDDEQIEGSAPTVQPIVPPPLPTVESLMDPKARDAWQRAADAITCALLPTRVMLWGPPGTGKTELPWRIAKANGWEHVYQLMTEETPGTELLGHLIVQGGSTVWCDGTLGRAIRASQKGPVVLVLDEIGRASQDALSACLLALTNPESLRLVLRSGEVLEPNPDNWHVVATSNDDPKQLPPAVADRLHINVMLVAPNPALVESMTTTEARRLACASSREYSVRALLTYDRLVAKGMTPREAARIVWEPQVAQSFEDAIMIAGGAW